MSVITDLKRLDGETDFEWKLRCCLAKKRHETDMDWSEIRDMLGLDVSTDHFRKCGGAYYEMYQYYSGFESVATTILSISDLHIPFQLPKETLADYVGQVDILQINGDVIDCQSLSKFPKLYRISPMEEMIQGRQYLIDLINYIKPKKVVVNWGNHDKRFINYLAKHLDTDILQLLPNTSLELIFEDGFRNHDKQNGTKMWYEPLKNVFSDIDIEFVDDWKSRIGHTIFVHPIAYRQAVLGTAEKALMYLHDTEKEPFDTVICAHTHQIGDTKRGNIRLIEQGAFANTTKMNYMDGKLTKPQKQGFAVICQDKNGNLINNKSKVIALN